MSVLVVGMSAVLGFAAPAAQGDPGTLEDLDPTVGYNCPQLMLDTRPRFFDVDTTDSAPAGAGTHGYIWVDRASSEYKVCVGWPDSSPPNPWDAYFSDQERGNNREAYVVVQFTDGGTLYTFHAGSWSVINASKGWHLLGTGISNFYVGVCLRIPGAEVADHCGWEPGARNIGAVPAAAGVSNAPVPRVQRS